MIHSKNKIISIVIPAYNGETFLSDTIDSIVAQKEESIELIICDDHSTDKTYDIVEKYQRKYDFIKSFRNVENLGMDRNFEKVADYAQGEYIWFSGQDDIFINGAIKKVLDVIANNSDIDFIYMNYSQRSHDLSKTIKNKMLNIEHDIKCNNQQKFLDITGLDKLPTFLPSYIIRKSYWDKVDKRRYYGTQYIQVGVLLSSLRNMKLYVVAIPYVVGRIPNDGWQKDVIKLLDIFTGNYEVIYDSFTTNSIDVPKNITKRFIISRKLIVLGLLLRIKKERLALNVKIKERILKTSLVNQKCLDYILSRLSPHVILFLRLDIIVLALYKLYSFKNCIVKSL